VTSLNTYNGLLRQVTGGSLDSEAEAWHAGTIPGSSMEGLDGEGKNSNNDTAADEDNKDDKDDDNEESDGEGRGGAVLPDSEPILMEQGSEDEDDIEEGSSEND
jgi:hypothetical protein